MKFNMDAWNSKHIRWPRSAMYKETTRHITEKDERNTKNLSYEVLKHIRLSWISRYDWHTISHNYAAHVSDNILSDLNQTQNKISNLIKVKLDFGQS